jgi:hypothetical protein
MDLINKLGLTFNIEKMCIGEIIKENFTKNVDIYESTMMPYYLCRFVSKNPLR